ncbi:MAG TPA: hypothetical protein PKD20_05410 [Candidatus Saccharibacteria bacterium]|nr:hypothetical protein [Candidatus Saccharibacteria bacterium]
MESRRPPKGQNTLAVLVAGGLLGIVVHETKVLERIGRTERPATEQLEPAPTTILTSEQRTELYGTQKLFICQIPDENGVLQTVEINIGGPETPLQIALMLEQQNQSRAIDLLSLGVAEYNSLEPAVSLLVDAASSIGVRRWDYEQLTTTQLWGIKNMTVDAYQKSTG